MIKSLYFLGGIFEESQHDYIEKNSRGVIQNAANAFQMNLLRGFDELLEDGVTLINLPFIGSYPRGFQKTHMPPLEGKFLNKSQIIQLDFCTLAFLNLISRLKAVLSFLIKHPLPAGSVVVVYSLHLPFLIGVLAYKFLANRRIKIVAVVPDLPQFMSESRNIIYRSLKLIDRMLVDYLVKKLDGQIFLTNFMAEHFGISKDYLVIEGIAPSREANYSYTSINPDIRTFFYSGTLARRYGVCELVDAFKKLDAQNVELIICGEGDSKAYIKKSASFDPRIKYLGQLPHKEILKLQESSTILINPRPPEGEFTKYSFPSKNLEYMSSGRPTLIYKLEGIPPEYYEFCLTIEPESGQTIFQAMNGALLQSDDQLASIGIKAQAFVFAHKTYIPQCYKILNFLNNLPK